MTEKQKFAQRYRRITEKARKCSIFIQHVAPSDYCKHLLYVCGEYFCEIDAVPKSMQFKSNNTFCEGCKEAKK